MTTGTDCIFCKIVLGASPCFRLLEDENTLAIMDIFPANDGHCLVLTKEHYPTLFDVTDEALTAVSHSVRRVARAVNQVLSPAGLWSRRTGRAPTKRSTISMFTSCHANSATNYS